MLTNEQRVNALSPGARSLFDDLSDAVDAWLEGASDIERIGEDMRDALNLFMAIHAIEDAESNG